MAAFLYPIKFFAKSLLFKKSVWFAAELESNVELNKHNRSAAKTNKQQQSRASTMSNGTMAPHGFQIIFNAHNMIMNYAHRNYSRTHTYAYMHMYRPCRGMICFLFRFFFCFVSLYSFLLFAFAKIASDEIWRCDRISGAKIEKIKICRTMLFVLAHEAMVTRLFAHQQQHRSCSMRLRAFGWIVLTTSVSGLG